MKDIAIAIKELNTGKSIVFAKEGEILYTEKSKGILPILRAMENRDLQGSSVADTVVGLAHAMISAEIGVEEIYGKVLSESARDYLKKKKIPFSYDIVVDKILDRTGNDLCPMEKRAQESSDCSKLIEKIEQFFEEMGNKR